MTNRPPSFNSKEQQINTCMDSISRTERRIDELNRKIGGSQESPNLSDVRERNELRDKLDGLQQQLNDLNGG